MTGNCCWEFHILSVRHGCMILMKLGMIIHSSQMEHIQDPFNSGRFSNGENSRRDDSSFIGTVAYHRDLDGKFQNTYKQHSQELSSLTDTLSSIDYDNERITGVESGVSEHYSGYLSGETSDVRSSGVDSGVS